MNPLELVAVPARAKALLAGLLAVTTACLALTCWALVERSRAAEARVEAVQARGERDRAIDQVKVVSAAAKACTAGVDQAAKVGAAAIAATGELAAAAARLSAPKDKEIHRIETVIQQPAPPGAGCEQAWDEIEKKRRMAGAP